MRPDDDSFTGLDHAQRGRTPRGGAIYHLSVRTASRSKGHSARAACAYIERSAEYGRAADAAAELVYTESGHMPGWANAEAGGAAYWDAADLYERSNGRLYKSMDFALPLALDAEQQQALAVTFAHHLTDAEQLPYTLAIHAGNGANPHCHLMISERTNDDLERSAEQWFKRYNAAEPEAGGARKSTALHPKDWLLETRAAWAEKTNEALREAGLEIQIDHRSLAAQGIERVPGIHLGPHVLEMEARGIQTERGQRTLDISQTNAQLQQLREQLREEGLDYGRDRQSEASPRAVPLSPRQPATPEPQRAADRDRGAAERDRAATDRVAELTPPDDGLAGGDQRAPGGALPDGAAAGRGAGGQRGRAVETGAGHGVRLDEPGARAAQGLIDGAQQSLEPPAGARTGASLGPEPGAVEGAGVGGVGERGRGADLPPGRPPAHGHHGVDESAERSLGLSPAMGHGDDGRAEENPEAAGGQDGREVDAAALATAQAQLAEAEAAIERAAEQAAARFAEAERGIERAAEQQRQLEKQLEKQREKEREKERGAELELDPFD